MRPHPLDHNRTGSPVRATGQGWWKVGRVLQVKPQRPVVQSHRVLADENSVEVDTRQVDPQPVDQRREKGIRLSPTPCLLASPLRSNSVETPARRSAENVFTSLRTEQLPNTNVFTPHDCIDKRPHNLECFMHIACIRELIEGHGRSHPAA